MTHKTIFTAFIFAGLLSACSSAPIGFGKAGPNEFLITTYPPLTVPPNFSLRAKGNRAKNKKAQQTAHKLLLGLERRYARNLSPIEQTLLKKLGTNKANPAIRKIIAEDRGLAILP